MRIVRKERFRFRAGISRKAAIGSDEECKMATGKAKIICRARGKIKLMKKLFDGMSTFEYVMFIRIGEDIMMAGELRSILKRY